jgi:hypothetical protein
MPWAEVRSNACHSYCIAASVLWLTIIFEAAYEMKQEITPGAANRSAALIDNGKCPANNSWLAQPALEHSSNDYTLDGSRDVTARLGGPGWDGLDATWIDGHSFKWPVQWAH